MTNALRLAVMVGPLLCCAIASGAPRPDPLYDAASRSFEEGDATRALEDLTKSIAAAPTARAHLLRAAVYVRLGQIDEARADYERVIALEKNPKLRAQAQKLRAALDSMPKARLQIRSTPPGATIFIDLKAEGPRGKTPQAVAVTPGRHRVMLELEGHEPFVQKDVIAVENQEIGVDATLISKTAPKPAPVVTPVAPVAPVAPPPPVLVELQLPAGSRATLDGAAAPTPLVLTPGTHALAITAPPQAKPSVARSWWLWTSIAIVVAGAGIGVGLAVGLQRPARLDVIRVFE